jgi:rhamnopyranosyl-N-acetylglucosaminyl-diphospho-decaprenol beta-1,3/1,4-galactofuranosyltransferase
MQIACVIVTFNRLGFLKDALRAVDAQRRTPDLIIIVDNCSSDGTAEWLAETAAARSDVMALTMDANYGGAGGFHHGIEAAWRWGADWIWTMDDDCHPAPDALTQLIRGIAVHPANSAAPIGFLASRVDWKDGRRHAMNVPGMAAGADRPRFAVRQKPVRIRYSSFVSILIHRRAVECVGLPVKQLFIYGDDVEFTRRITTAGFAAYFIESSRVRHLTAENRGVTMDRLVAWPPRMKRRDIALRNLVAVNRNEPYGVFREPGRLAWVWLKLMANKTPIGIQFQLLKSGIFGLFFNYKQWIVFPAPAGANNKP